MCQLVFAFSKKYIKKLLFHERKFDSLVGFLAVAMPLRKARVLMEHLEAERSHISIHCRSDRVCVISSEHRETQTDNPQHWLISEWRELPLQYNINNKPVRL